MTLSALSIIFRIAAIIIAFIVGVLGYKVYVNTRGATKGWAYFSAGAISLLIWALLVMFFTIIVPHDPLRLISGAIFLGVIAISMPVGYTKLANDFGAKMPSFVKVKFMLPLVILTYAVFFILNIFTGGLNLSILASVSHISLAFAMLYSCVPTYYLMRQTKVSAWMFAFLFCLVIGLSVQVGQYYSNCCADNMAQEQICEGFSLDYSEVYPTSCYKPLVQFGSFYQLFLVLGIIFATVSTYKIWQQVRT